MANVLTTNPIYLDTFTDAVLFTGPVTVRAITWRATNAKDRLVLDDRAGNMIVEIENPTANSTQQAIFPGGQKFASIAITEADGRYNTGDHALIYLV